MKIQGFCQPKFTEVQQAFERNFLERGELGASVCISYQGETVVDLWGGLADPKSSRPWQEDTVTVVWSSTKGAVALCAHILAARGQLDLGAPVARYWPEFAQNGKEGITVEMLLSHQAGLPAFSEPITDQAFCDWADIVQRLAAQKPLWEPGTQHGYHALTFGHLIGEVVRRITGRSLGSFFQDEVAGPLGLDFWIGLPEAVRERVAPILPANPPRGQQRLSKFMLMATQEIGSIPSLLLLNSGHLMLPGAINQAEFLAAEIPAANGVTNARSLAGMYRPLALDGSYGAVRLLPEDALHRMSAVQSAAFDLTLQLPTRFSLGFLKAGDNRRYNPEQRDSFLVSEDAFGHTGAGGSVGFADARAQLSFGYVMNQQGSSISLDERGQSLIDAAYRAIGYRQSEFDGIWFPARRASIMSSAPVSSDIKATQA